MRQQDYRDRFDDLFERGSGAVLAGTHVRDVPLTDGGRWGMSVVFTPTDALAVRLGELTHEAMAFAGPEHWPTGCRTTVHATVRALEPHRTRVPAGDPLIRRSIEALRRTALRSAPVRLRWSGLTLTPSGVMACAYPVDAKASDFASRLRDELGADAWFEEHFDRTIWYATLLHFTAAIQHPQALVDWVAARRDATLGEPTLRSAELIRFAYNGRQPARINLASAPLRTNSTP